MDEPIDVMKEAGEIAARILELKRQGQDGQAVDVLQCKSEALARRAGMEYLDVKGMVSFHLSVADDKSACVQTNPDQLQPNPANPRVDCPLVRQLDGGGYEIVSGQNRLMAQLQVGGKARVFDVGTHETLTVKQVDDRLVVVPH